MAEHVLITYAIRRPYCATPAVPDNAQYDAERGYWTKDGMALVVASEFEETTKKCDQETGEDQKGE